MVDYKKMQNHQLTHSVGRVADGVSEWSIFTNQTPGGPNENEVAYLGYVPTPYFNLDAGLYSDDIDLAIECDAKVMRLKFIIL